MSLVRKIICLVGKIMCLIVTRTTLRVSRHEGEGGVNPQLIYCERP